MGTNIDLKAKFQEYLHEQESSGLQRSERLYDVLTSIRYNPLSTSSSQMEIISRWLEAAFIQGARVMAQDTVDTLRDYGTVTAGIDVPPRNPTECFDAAAENLMVYYTKVLDAAEK